jgi:hypothetical protein
MVFVIAGQSCSYEEYEPQIVSAISFKQDRTEKVVSTIKDFAEKNGFQKQIGRRDIIKKDQKRFIILFKNKQSFINIKNVSSKDCIDISIYLDERNNKEKNAENLLDSLVSYLKDNANGVFIFPMLEGRCDKE